MSSKSFHWDGTTLRSCCTEWTIDLEREIQSAAMETFLTQNALYWQSWTDVPFPNLLKDVSIRLQEQVLRRTGIALVKCGLRRTSDEARLLQLILGCEFGPNVTKTPETNDRPLFALQATDNPTVSGTYSGNGLRGNVIGFHTDGSGSTDRNVDVLALLCIHPARFGGQSRVANAQMAYSSLPQATREILLKAFPRENPFAPGAVPTALKVAPIFCEVQKHGINYLHFSYHPQRVRNGIAHNPEEFEELIKSFDLLDKALERFSCDINLMRNEILFVNNCVVAHDRYAFVDDPQAKRFLERFWAGTFVNTAANGQRNDQLSFCVSSGM